MVGPLTAPEERKYWRDLGVYVSKRKRQFEELPLWRGAAEFDLRQEGLRD